MNKFYKSKNKLRSNYEEEMSEKYLGRDINFQTVYKPNFQENRVSPISPLNKLKELKFLITHIRCLRIINTTAVGVAPTERFLCSLSRIRDVFRSVVVQNRLAD